MECTSSPSNHGAIDFEEALAVIRSLSNPLPVRRLPVVDGLDGVLAFDVCAVEDFPAFDMSAMDGFALSSRDTDDATEATPAVLSIQGAIYAGASGTPMMRPGQTVGIATGAPIPSGCDAVLQQERCSAILSDGGSMVSIGEPVRPSTNIRRRGEDAHAAERVARAGEYVTPAMIGALCCYGVGELSVRISPAVSILTTGDELATVGGHGAGRIRDGNGPMLAAACRAAGLDLRSRRSVGDGIARLDAALDAILVEDRPTSS